MVMPTLGGIGMKGAAYILGQKGFKNAAEDTTEYPRKTGRSAVRDTG